MSDTPEIVELDGDIAAKVLEKALAFTTASEQSSTLWHYTNAVGLQGILKDRAIRATHVAHLNDRAELVTGKDMILEVARNLAHGPPGPATRLFKEFERSYPALCLSSIGDVFIASFCNDGGDRLSQWRGYSGGCGGYSIGFTNLPKPERAAGEAELGVVLVEVLYDREDFMQLATTELQRIAHTVEQHCSDKPQHQQAFLKKGWQLMLQRAGSLAIRAKHNGFHEEFEWRLVAAPMREKKADGTPIVQHRSGHQGLVPYVEIPLSDAPTLPLEAVKIGPTQDPNHAKRALRSFMEGIGYQNAFSRIVSSNTPFRA